MSNGAQRTPKPGVAGSSPATPVKSLSAQSSEHIETEIARARLSNRDRREHRHVGLNVTHRARTGGIRDLELWRAVICARIDRDSDNGAIRQREAAHAGARIG